MSQMRKNVPRAQMRGLNRRTRNRAIGTEHAAITRLRPQRGAAAATWIKEPTGIGGHRLGFCRCAIRASDDGSENHDFRSTAQLALVRGTQFAAHAR
jgi:hypothetical protein